MKRSKLPPLFSQLPRIIRAAAPLCVVIAICVLISECSHHLGAPATRDFKRMWASAGVLRSGGNPFDPLAVDAYAQSHNAGAAEQLPFYYPPMAFTSALPLALISYDVARIGYLAAVALLFCGMWLVPACLGLVRSASVETSLRLLCYLSFAPGIYLWWIGAFSIVVLLALCGIVALLSQNKTAGTSHLQRLGIGVLSSLILIKPNIAPLVLPYLGTIWLMQSNKAACAGFLLGLALLTAPLAIFGFSLQSAFSATNFASSLNWQTPALSRYLQELLGVGPWLRWVVFLSGGALAIYLGSRKESNASRADTLALIIIPIGALTTPFIWTYDFVVLAISLTAIVERSLKMAPAQASSAQRDTHHDADHHIYYRAPLAALITNVMLCMAPPAMALHWFYPIGIATAALMTHRVASAR